MRKAIMILLHIYNWPIWPRNSL